MAKDINQEIAIAQNTLSELTAAINREVAAKEVAIADLNAIEAQIFALHDSILACQKEKDLAEREMAKAIEDTATQKKDLQEIVAQLQIKLDDMHNAMMKLELTHTETIERRNAEIAEIEDAAKSRLLSINNDIELSQKSLAIVKSEHEKALQEKNDTIAQTKQTIEQGDNANKLVATKQETLLSMESKVQTLRYEEKQLSESIGNLATKREELQDENSNLTLEIAKNKGLKLDLETSIVELNARNTELVGRTATIQERERACEIREEMIKLKYQEAGITYI